MNIADAVACAYMILASNGHEDLKMPLSVPVMEFRAVTEQDRRRGHVSERAIGLFYPVQPNGLVIAESWDVMVHEAVHFIEFKNHLPLREDWAYFAQDRAYQCNFGWTNDCPAGAQECWVTSLAPR